MRTAQPRLRQRGVGLIEIMVSIVIAMLLVLVIYQVYEISEGQKRTITAGSDAQQNASYGLFVLGRDLAVAGNGIASSARERSTAARCCARFRSLITAGATDERSRTRSRCSTAARARCRRRCQFKQTANTAATATSSGTRRLQPRTT